MVYCAELEGVNDGRKPTCEKQIQLVDHSIYIDARNRTGTGRNTHTGLERNPMFGAPRRNNLQFIRRWSDVIWPRAEKFRVWVDAF